MINYYFETGDPLGEIVAHENLESAMEYADTHDIDLISEIGGDWRDFIKCAFCGEWFESEELDENCNCERCARAWRDHDGEG